MQSGKDQINLEEAKMYNRIVVTTVLALLLIGSAWLNGAGVPETINYQGVLTNPSGDPVPDGNYQVVFRICDAAVSGTELWNSGSRTVSVGGGLFTYQLGSAVSFPQDLFATEDDRWLGITVESDPEISPRVQLTSVPYAIHTRVADTSRVGGGWIDDGSVVKLANSGDNVGIATNFPQAKLHVIHNFYSDDDLFRAETDIPMGGRLAAMVMKKDGSLGIRTDDPLAMVHIQADELFLNYEDTHNEWLLIEGTDATMGIYCELDGPDGAAITLGQISEGTLWDKWSLVRETPAADYGGSGLRITYGGLSNPWENNTMFRINPGGNVAIGREDPGNHRLYVESSNSGVGGAAAFISNTSPDGIGLMVENHSEGLAMIVSQKGEYPDGEIFRCDSWTGGWHRVFAVKNSGRVICSELQLTGGADIAEPFQITGEQEIQKGAVVVIDAENPGQLTLSNVPYDTRVAGIVSGAGGVNPGITLTQEDVFAGQQNIAISGRVYCLADASYSAIKPGDLMTTSPTTGYAMKATDRTRAYGAVIGKAMTGLTEGQGLVLVLVNLQ
jgi:hypothetical protein